MTNDVRSMRSTSERIVSLAGSGLKVRDISSLLHIHPLIVIRVLNDSDVDSYRNGSSVRELGVDSKSDHDADAQVICDS
ncbi:hypothetical protein ACFPN2_00810 [Steroidobacter flavus]|uniref:Resolvase HTH domain-containing protein n=1 Tax=Steroidobacter flavus TaxID=1842136 RepID=A0ABV8SJ20_9GAMM